MKKSILIIASVLTTFSLAAFGYINWGGEKESRIASTTSKKKTKLFKMEDLKTIHLHEELKLIYKVGTRFNATITKDKLHKAKSIVEIYPTKAITPDETYENTEVSLLHHSDETTSIKGNDEILSLDQLNLLQSTDYSNSILVSSLASYTNSLTGNLQKQYLVYYLTVIPEKEAEYTKGNDELINYLRNNSREETKDIEEDKLKPGRVNFTISKTGTIENVKLSSTSGYSYVDKKLIQLVQNIPGKWIPAQNLKGESVNQELVFFFGLEGC